MPIRNNIEISEEDAILYDELLEKSAYYNRLQMVAKLSLNSAYGALCNRFFKFYDLRLGASTTATGQEILKHQTCKVNELLTGEYNLYGESIIYGDTDSTYFKTFANDIDTAVKVGDVIGKKINESFPEFMREAFFCTPGYDTLIETDREIIGSSGIFIAKKLYIIHIVDNEGKKCDKLKAMGVSLKKTTLPKEFQNALGEYVERILKREDWYSISKDIVDFKHSLSTTDDIMRIGLPIGVKNIEKYSKEYNQELNTKTNIINEMSVDNIDDFFNEISNINNTEEFKARLPGNVAASLHWNRALKEYHDHESLEITSGTKIKIFYLKSKFYNKFKSIAIPTDSTFIPDWFIEHYKNEIDIDAQLLRLIDMPLKNILEAINKVVPTRQSLINDDLISF